MNAMQQSVDVQLPIYQQGTELDFAAVVNPCAGVAVIVMDRDN